MADAPAGPVYPLLPHEHEALCFTRALIGEAASPYVIAQYERAHEILPLEPATALDRVLVELAALDPLGTRVADAYGRLFAPAGALRRKCTVLVAILESSAPWDAAFAPETSSPAGVVIRLAGAGATFALALAAGVLLVGPLHCALLLGWDPS